MKGTKTYRLGDLIELCDERNTEGKYTVDDVRGISIQKNFIETKADMNGVILFPYILVRPDYFAYVTVTSRNGEKITIAHNTSEKIYIVSSSYIVFRITHSEILDSDYLFMFFNRPEFDRYARFNSWGSARETFSWEDMCDMQITLPPLAAQQKAVAVYHALKANLAAYEQGLEDLKLVCDGFIDTLKHSQKTIELGFYIEEVNTRNSDGKLNGSRLYGVNFEGNFISSIADQNSLDLTKYKIVSKNNFAYTLRIFIGSIALFREDSQCIVSTSYTIFKIKDDKVNELLPDYLDIWFRRKEFQRYAEINSWGSSKVDFSFSEMCDVQIPLPSLEVQQSIVNMYKCYTERRRIAAELKEKIKAVCPILIKGSLENM